MHPYLAAEVDRIRHDELIAEAAAVRRLPARRHRMRRALGTALVTAGTRMQRG